eukprot:8629107-Pyramimonas_sp.AAC.1
MSAAVGAAASAAPRGVPRAPGPYAPGAAAAGSLGAAPVLPAARGAGAWPSTVSSRGKMGPPRVSRGAVRRSLSPSGS